MTMLAIIATMLSVTAPGSSDPAAGLVTELNRARADPPAYARELQRRRHDFRGKIVREPGDGIYRITQEGVAALDEAVRALRRQPPLPPLGAYAPLALAAGDHVRDQGPRGLRGHDGSDGSTVLDRALRRGTRPWAVGEVIAYGPESAEAVVRELIIDDGVPDRGHRRAIFNPDFGRAGAACGPHKGYGIMCVIDLASPTDAPTTARRTPD